MKKLAILFPAVLIASIMTSCKKDHTCTCTITSGSSTFTATIIAQKTSKRALAQGQCASGTSTSTNGGTTQVSTTNCTIN